MSKKPVGSEVSTEKLTVSRLDLWGAVVRDVLLHAGRPIARNAGSVIVKLIQVNVVAHGTQINNSLLFSSFFFLLILLLLLIIIIP